MSEGFRAWPDHPYTYFFRSQTDFFRLDFSVCVSDNPYIMIVDPITLRGVLAEAIERSNFDATSLAKKINKGSDYVRDFLNGRKNSIPSKQLSAIEEALGFKQGSLYMTAYAGTQGMSYQRSDFDESFLRPWKSASSEDLVQSPIPMLSSAETLYGEMRIYFDKPLQSVPRPWFLADSSEGYAVLVSEMNMKPAYNAGDVIIVSPRLPLVSGRDYVFRREREESSSIATIRQLLDWSADRWKVKQFKDDREYELDRRLWPFCERVVGKACD